RCHVLQRRPGEESAVGQSVWQSRGHGLRRCLGYLARRVVRRGRLRVPDLLRFQRLLRHGDWPRADAGFRLGEELRRALPGAVDHRVLAPLEHLAVELAPRLPLRPPRGEPPGRTPDLSESGHRDGAGRPLAWGVMELRPLGCSARWPARLRAGVRQAAALLGAAHTAPGRGDLRAFAIYLGLFWRQRPTRRLGLLRHDARLRYARRLGVAAVWHHYAAVLSGNFRAVRVGRVDVPTDVGLVVPPRPWQGCDGAGVVLAGCDCAHDPGVQPVHLFYLLTSRSARITMARHSLGSGIREHTQRPLSREDV